MFPPHLIDLYDIIGSSDRSLKIEWVDKPCEKTRRKKGQKRIDEQFYIDVAF